MVSVCFILSASAASRRARAGSCRPRRHLLESPVARSKPDRPLGSTSRLLPHPLAMSLILGIDPDSLLQGGWPLAPGWLKTSHVKTKGCHRGLGHMHCDSAGPWQASASRRLRKGCPGAMSSTRTTQIWRGASIGRAVRVGCASVRPPSVMLPCPPACTSLVSCLQKTPKKFSGNAPQMSLQKLSQNRPPCLSVGSRPRYH